VTTLALPHRWTGAALASNPVLFAAVVLARRTRRRFKRASDRRRLEAMPDNQPADIGRSRRDLGPDRDFARIRRMPDAYRL